MNTHHLSLFRVPPLLIMILAVPFLAEAGIYDISTASFLGGPGSDDRVAGARILSDGTVVLAANIGSGSPSGGNAARINGAGPTWGGVIIRLSEDGRKVLSVSRVAKQVNDLAVDDADNLYVAAHDAGFLKLNAAADALLFKKDVPRGRYAWRVDAGPSGHFVTLEHKTAETRSNKPGSGIIHVYDPAGQELGEFKGYRNTLDICVDTENEVVVYTGWRQTRAAGNPVQISYIRAQGYDGVDKWLAYDWSNDKNSKDYLNKPENNMADTRGTRCSIGRDGKLYVAFQSAGGNHMFRYDPFNVTKRVKIVGGDNFHEWFNTRSEHKTFFARYEPRTGKYLAGQQFCSRKGSDNGGNTVVPHEIMADSQGRVYLSGASAYGIPIPPHRRYEPAAGQTAFNPLHPAPKEVYLGGAFLLVMSKDLRTRLYCTRLSSGGITAAVDARVLSGKDANIVFAGLTAKKEETHRVNAIQEDWGGGKQDGWFAVIQAPKRK